jgi:hypothetical protein
MNSSLGVALALALAGLAQPLAAAPAQTPDAAAAAEPALSKAQIYGVINPDGTILPGSKGILMISHPNTGVYCILPTSLVLQRAVAAGTLMPQLTVVDTGCCGDLAVIYTYAPIGCPTTSYIPIVIFNTSSGNNYNTKFVISFD